MPSRCWMSFFGRLPRTKKKQEDKEQTLDENKEHQGVVLDDLTQLKVDILENAYEKSWLASGVGLFGGRGKRKQVFQKYILPEVYTKLGVGPTGMERFVKSPLSWIAGFVLSGLLGPVKEALMGDVLSMADDLVEVSKKSILEKLQTVLRAKGSLESLKYKINSVLYGDEIRDQVGDEAKRAPQEEKPAPKATTPDKKKPKKEVKEQREKNKARQWWEIVQSNKQEVVAYILKKIHKNTPQKRIKDRITHMNPKALAVMASIIEKFGPLRLTSTIRTKETSIGAEDSYHKYGLAFDIENGSKKGGDDTKDKGSMGYAFGDIQAFVEETWGTKGSPIVTGVPVRCKAHLGHLHVAVKDNSVREQRGPWTVGDLEERGLYVGKNDFT